MSRAEASPAAARPIAVVTTVASRDDARRIGLAMVDRNLAACAQVSAIDSIYRWKGVVQEEPEFRLLLKTTEARYAAVEAAIRDLHPYDLPAIHAFAFAHVDEAYAAWIAENAAGG